MITPSTSTARAGSNDGMLNAIQFDAAGLVRALAQQYDTGEILMLAWMNRASIVETLETARICYWSRSRQAIWRKGETSV